MLEQMSSVAPPVGGGLLIPMAEALILTHIFGGTVDKGIDKAGLQSSSTMRHGLSGYLANLVCKMWVKVRAEARGLLAWNR
jgi:hypothetical protein